MRLPLSIFEAGQNGKEVCQRNGLSHGKLEPLSRQYDIVFDVRALRLVSFQTFLGRSS